MKDLSHLPRVKPDLGKAQWVEAKCTGVDPAIGERTHTFGVPYLMPCTIIFLHGVNSEGEWYRDAASQFAIGLNERLGRRDLEELKADPKNARRFERSNDKGRYRSPIIPFYWGYAVPTSEKKKLDHRDNVFTDRWGNPLRVDGSWGGGPFQNGTSTLTQFWSELGFRRDAFGFDANKVNPIVGRQLFDCPNRLYYVHAARRLANLVKTIREDFPNEPIILVSHSQGTMVALCALFFMDEWGVRVPDTVMLNSSPWRFDNHETDYGMARASRHEVPTAEARIKTFANAAAIVDKAKTDDLPEWQAPNPVVGSKINSQNQRRQPGGHRRNSMKRSLEPRRLGARIRVIGGSVISAALLSACGIAGMSGPYPGVPDVVDARKLPRYEGPVATPYPAYRIDENRYFEIVPRTNRDCYDSTVVYVDKLKGIRSRIYDTSKLSYRPTLIIDAANDQYLVGPMSRGSLDCSSGGGGCGGPSIPYSTDGGRTWNRIAAVNIPERGLSLTGSTLYSDGPRNIVDFVDLSKGSFEMRDWDSLPKYAKARSPRKPPLDRQFLCTRRGQE